VKHAANSLLTEGNKTKFFQKYRAVSQELEKCLDDLLLISAAISSLEDEEEEESAGSEEDDKPPDDLSPTTSHEGMGVLGFTQGHSKGLAWQRNDRGVVSNNDLNF
jgi:hypothetical protein